MENSVSFRTCTSEQPAGNGKKEKAAGKGKAKARTAKSSAAVADVGHVSATVPAVGGGTRKAWLIDDMQGAIDSTLKDVPEAEVDKSEVDTVQIMCLRLSFGGPFAVTVGKVLCSCDLAEPNTLRSTMLTVFM